MNIDVVTSEDVNSQGGGYCPPSTGLASDALPEVQKPVVVENSHTGVSTRNALSGTDEVVIRETCRVCALPSGDGRRTENPTVTKVIKRKPKEVPHWYALRVTYGREKKAYDYLIGKHVEAYYPTITTVKIVDGKRKTVEESRLPNIFFARGTEEEVKSFVYDNVNLPYLRFYYRYCGIGNKVKKAPLIVPDDQIESLRIICKAESDDIIVSTDDIPKFLTGQTVRIIEGKFKGVTGVVARYQGQQRVGIVIDGLLTVATAYIPGAFLEKIC